MEAPVQTEERNSASRPTGITILAIVAFISTACILFVLGRAILGIVHSAKTGELQYETAVSPLRFGIIPLAILCAGLLAWISFVSGLDLLRLRLRGRQLTLIGVYLIFLPAFANAIYNPGSNLISPQRLISGSISLLCLASIVYLLLPKTRARFS